MALITISVQICSDASIHTAALLHVADYIFVSLTTVCLQGGEG